MIYLTYNDQPSGVYSSQVNDVVNYFHNELGQSMQLVAFISIRKFLKNRSLIKKEVSHATVLPIFPKATYHGFSSWMFLIYCLLSKHKSVISRNVVATLIALKARDMGALDKVCYDGRGAIAAEWKEYDVVSNEKMIDAIHHQESYCVLQSDHRISVSTKLVEYWKNEFNYSGSDHEIIPCTLSSSLENDMLPDENIQKLRLNMGYSVNDIVLVYSGSTAGWQSFSKLESLFHSWLSQNENIKILFLSKKDKVIESLESKYKARINCKWVMPSEVKNQLLCCDYGIMYRDQSTTNRVAAPTKFAEYLSAGLKVLISKDLGDYSSFVLKHNCGTIIHDEKNVEINKVEYADKILNSKLSVTYFKKSSYRNEYLNLIDKLNS